MNRAMNRPTPARILVVDDEPDLRTLYELTLLREGHLVQTAGTVAEARAVLAEQPFDVVITDLRLPDGLGLDILRWLSSQARPERSIMITAYGSAENAVEALKSGAFDYLTKPVDLKQFRQAVLAAQAAALQGGANAPGPSAEEPPRRDSAASAATQRGLDRLVGESAAMRGVKQRIAKVGLSMAPVLVRGESGTGKELVAHALHDCSHRRDGPFVPVNCGAIPENLLEAEFFGARKGAYTGAAHDRDGFFQAAHGGTLFLDEIGDLPLGMQAKLLRAIQERRIRPIGATREEAVDVRIVSATHKDLSAEVQAGRFRQDLYYRLNVIEIVVPALRERREDLPALCAALLARIASESGAAPLTLRAQQFADICAQPLPGNVRELENLLHRAIALHEDDAGDDPLFIDMAQAAMPTKAPANGCLAASPSTAPEHSAATPLPSNLEDWLDQQERAMLVRALQDTGFNRTAAAARLGLNLRQMRYRMARLGITGPSTDTPDDDTP